MDREICDCGESQSTLDLSLSLSASDSMHSGLNSPLSGSEIVSICPTWQPTVNAPSKARLFCQQAFADCELDDLDKEISELTRDLEKLQSNMAWTRRLLA